LLETREHHITYDVWWDGKGVAAAYLPGVQYVEVVNDPSNSSNRIVYKYPMMIGLSGVVRGSYTEFNATIPGGYYYVLEWFKVKNVTLAFAGGLGQTSYSYTITITSNTTNTYEIAAQAWIQARVGISLGLKLMDFASASLDLASVEAGVSYTVKYVSRTTSGYTYSVTFTIPDLNKITVFYQVKAYGYYYYYEEYSGSGPIPESRVATADYTPLPQSSSDATSYETVILLVLNAAGRFEGYTPFTSIGNFPSMYDEYDVGLTTGILVYDY